jgi:hypothetical protein
MSQNKLKVTFNPLTNDFELINDLELGWTVRNRAKAPFFVLGGFTRMYPNLEIPDGMDIEVRDDGELQVP